MLLGCCLGLSHVEITKVKNKTTCTKQFTMISQLVEAGETKLLSAMVVGGNFGLERMPHYMQDIKALYI